MTPQHARELVRAAVRADWRAPRSGGLADGRSVRDFESEQLARGLIVELEHTDDAALAMRIAMDHLIERKDYYELLEALERAPRAANPTTKRLEWIADRYSPEVLAAVMVAFAEATGDHGARDAVSNLFLWRPGGQPHPTPSTVMDYARNRLVVQKHTRYDRYLPWLARELSQVRDDVGARWWSSRAAEMMINQFRAVVDWAEAEHVDLNRYRWPQALQAADAWREGRVVGAMPQGDVVYEFKDKWTVQELKTAEQLEAEGDVMQHCVGGYNPGDIGRLYRIFSLRDPKGRPHATMEWSPSALYVVQLRGKQNDEPAPDYMQRMVGFRDAYLEDGWEEAPPEARDGYDRFGNELLDVYVDSEGKLHFLYRGKRDGMRLYDEKDMRSVFDGSIDWMDRNWIPEGVDPDDDEAMDAAYSDAYADFLSSVHLEDLSRIKGLWLHDGPLPTELEWRVYRDHEIHDSTTEDEMLHWLIGGEWNPQCRFLGRVANNALRQRLMPPQGRFSRLLPPW